MLRHLLAGTAAVALVVPALAQQADEPNVTTTTVPIQQEETQAQDQQPLEEQAQPAQDEPAAEPQVTQEQPLQEEPAEAQVTEEQPLEEEPAEAQVTEEQPIEEEPAEQRAGVAPEETFISAQEEGLLLASELMNVNVIDAQGESIGGVDDILVDPEGGIFGAVVSVGGFLGIGSKQVALSWNEFKYAPEEQTAYLDVTREELEQAPDFQTLEDLRREEEARLAQEQAQQPMMEQPVPPPQQ